MKKLFYYLSRLRLCLFHYLLLSYLVSGQLLALSPPQNVVSGTVTDTFGNPLAGVNVVVESRDVGAISDMDGSFSLQAGPTDVLVFSMIGFKSITVPIAGREEVIVQLEEDVTVLGEVVLNAGYYTVSEKERTGNIATFKADIIDKQPVANPLGAMQGHLSGVNIIQSTGVPGGGFSIEVRGRNSINGISDPLFIVDGVPFGSQSLGATAVSSDILSGNISPLNAINPNDIESIEVLKDADATAIYGSRAANGVVLITTKKGKAGETRFDARFSTSLGKVSHYLDLMDTQQYLEVRREGITNDGFGAFLEDPAYDFVWPDVKSWDNDRYTDWQKELIGGTAYRNSAQLSISGGSSGTQFLVNGAYQKETTVFPGDSKYKKASVHSNINHNSKNGHFKLNLSTIYSDESNVLPSTDFTYEAYTLEPNAPKLYGDDGELNWENNTWDNPLASLREEYEAKINTLIANAGLTYLILPGLELKASLGFNSYELASYKTLPSTARNPSLGLTPESYSNTIANSSSRSSWIVEPQLNWQHRWKGLKLDILVGTTFQQETTQQLVQKATGFPNDNLLRNFAAAETLEVLQDSESEYRYNAVFGRVNLALWDRYILNLTGRRDGSSRFGPGKQFGNFGAIGLAWLFSEEHLFSDSPILSFGKIRGSFGKTGSDNIGDYKFLDTYTIPGLDYDGTTLLTPSGVFNPLFGWEENNKLEAALELGFFNDRVMINTSWYRNRSSNQLVGIPLAATTGFSELIGNFDATVENSGLEVDLRTINLNGKKFQWSTTFNLTVPKNKLVKYDGLETSTFADTYIIGKPLTIVKLYHALGVDPETGIYQCEDYNGDGDISSLGDRQWVEDLAPKFYGGMGNTFRYGKISLDFFLQFKKQKAYNELSFVATPGSRVNAPVALFDRWQQPGDTNPIQKASGGLSLGEDTGAFQKRSNAAVSDASFARLRNISLSYAIPNLEDGLDINVYLQGQNLLTLTSYKGPDPEQPSNTRLPQLRRLTLGIQISF